MTYIPYGRQAITTSDIEAVVDVLNSDFLTQGPAVPRFEQDLVEFTNAKYAKVTNSATSALHLACLALGVGVGDIVWTSAITFVASANCALYCGATVDFIDIDPATNNLDLGALEMRLSNLASKGHKLPKVVVGVHFAGLPLDMPRLKALSETYGFKIIEDASHAIGASVGGYPVGSSQFSDVTVFSFHPVKIVTTGEGGAILTNDRDIARKVELLRSHGITRDPEEMKNVVDGPWYYEQVHLGFNYRMTDIQAALGSSQLRKIKKFISERQQVVRIYEELFSDVPDVLLPAWSEISAWHLYVIRVPEDSALGSRNQIFERLRQNGIGANLHYIPVYRQPYYSNFGYDKESFPEAEKYYREAITLPLFPGLTKEQQKMVVDVIVAPFGHQTIF